MANLFKWQLVAIDPIGIEAKPIGANDVPGITRYKQDLIFWDWVMI
jgi:hypothetical protein